MLHSIVVDCQKRGGTVLHFVNASPKVMHSISSSLPSSGIAFLTKVKSIKYTVYKNSSSLVFNLQFSGPRVFLFRGTVNGIASHNNFDL